LPARARQVRIERSMTKRAHRRRGIDGRRLRSERTKHLLIEAYLELLRESLQVPTAVQIAERVGCSARLIYERFSDLRTLSLAAANYAVALGKSEAVTCHVDGDRRARIESHATTCAQTCERWLPLWRTVMANQVELAELRTAVDQVRLATIERLKLMYRPELSTLAASRRRQILIALEALVDFESWGRMRERHGLSAKAARDAWITAIDRMLPPTPPAC
jgi:hypothetical protein